MDQDSVKSSPERAVSSEPCSTHPLPFDDSEQHSARKRQKTSRSGSRSRSVDTTQALDILPDSMSSHKDNIDGHHHPLPPSTPTRPTTAHSQAGPTSSQVTINLRTPQHRLESPSPTSPSPMSQSNIPNTMEDEVTRISIESESDVLSTVPASVIETPSSSPSATGSPEVELVPISSDDPERSPTLAIINEEEVFPDPLNHFPYQRRGENLLMALRRATNILQYEAIDTEDIFIRLRNWIDDFLRSANSDNRLHGAFTRYRDFWFSFSDLILALHFRSVRFGPFMYRVNAQSKSLTQFLYRYAKLTGRFLAMDVRTLTYDADQTSELVSPHFLRTYAQLQKFDTELSHIGKSMEACFNWKWDEDTAEFQAYFEEGGGSMILLTRYVEGQLRLIPNYPRLFENLTDPTRLVERMSAVASATTKRQAAPDVHDDAMRKLAIAYEYFNIMSSGLDSIIEKNVTFLTLDAATTHLSCLSYILWVAASAIPQIASARFESQKMISPGIADAHLSKVAAVDWKVSVLQKLITSSQMQLRVIGVTTLCLDLVSLFSSHRPKEGKEANSSNIAILSYFAKFLLQHKLIDYIVGIGSHPEIINESHNIVGFLVVTKTYQDEHTDTIWQTVTTSQDPRVVEAILKMVKKIFHLYDFPQCLYICQKVAALPIQAFTVAMRDFCESLFRELAHKLGPKDLDISPYEICVRLIRESSITSDDCPNGYPEIQNFAANNLRELLVHGPGPEARNGIYLSCIRDISEKSATAPGSICVISALLHQSLMPDLQALTTQHGLTRLMVAELESNIAGHRSLAYDSPANIARREIILQIILMDPDTINAELGTRLWNLLVGSQSNDAADRLAGWQILNNAFQKAKFSNRYLVICFQSYLPKLEPAYFSDGTLLFVKNGVYFWLDEQDKESQENEDIKLNLSFDSFAIEQLWRIIESAPQETVYEMAIQELVSVYVGPFIRSLPLIKARELHLAFLTRCLDKLANAARQLEASSTGEASGDDEDMVIVIPESQVKEQELLFTRSLAALRTFLAAYSSTAHFATPKLRSAIKIPSVAAHGTSLTIFYQAFGETTSSIKKLTIGADEDAATLVAKLQKETDFTSCRVFYGGKELKHEETELCKSVQELNLNGLVLVKRRDETDPLLPSNKGPLELEITRKFDQIWSYLGMQENLAEKIYSFLIQFPVYDRILQDLSNSIVPYTEIFPLGQPYKALYSLYGLKQYISTQSSKGSVDNAVFDRAMTLLVAAISDPRFLDNGALQAIKENLTMHFISSFTSLLKDPALPQSSMDLIDKKLLDRLLDLLYTSKLVTTTDTSVHLIWACIEALLEVASQNSALWTTFVSHLNGSTLLQDLLLEDFRPFVRKAISKHIASKCTFNSNPAHVSPSEVSYTLWPIIARLIPKAVQRPEQCEETFSLALTIFKRLLETPIDLDLNAVAQEWGNLLLAHDNHEDVGVPEAADMITRGLVDLLHHAVITMKQSEQKLSCEALGAELFKRHLFPSVSTDNDIGSDGLIAQKIPLINSKTRKTLCETIFALVKDDITRYREMLQICAEVAPYDSERNSNPYLLDMPPTFDRSKSVRSSTGYVGLRNLSNTCYLNSLVTQLFMNISFREFILNLHIPVPRSQKLLFETQQLFAYMQNSVVRCVEPANFAASITTFDELEIDVHVQMDVDEFYNLIIDRFEREPLDDDDKRKVRSFYGGKLVQQIKSKECPHISERLEDFSAIQCDIKGKQSLEESLQAYVEGEAMEGDNKYKCGTCDRHVDAVKRACLTDVPDNLIFHLKRFDFNLRTLARNKINDYFTFPPSIDMRPYKVEYLMNESGEVEEDMFELVGVLVHSGTAESGHYYSYIRERPQVDGKVNWMEFNDDSVTSWDPVFMEGSCFGGLDYGTADDVPFEKNYSAYMLFYQRRSTLIAANEQFVKEKNENPSIAALEALQAGHATIDNKPVIRHPLKVAIKPHQANQITLENEHCLRKYCLYDPAHVTFIRDLFENTRHLNETLNNGKCSELHEVENKAMWVAMYHLDQVVGRMKDVPDIGKYASILRAQCQHCGECSRDFLDYLCKCTDSFRFLLLRCPEAVVRSEVSTAVLGAMVTVKNVIKYAYGLGNNGDIRAEDPNLLHAVVAALIRLYENFHNNIRAWPEYFGLLASIANLGNHEAAVLLDSGFLMKAIDIICADTADNNSQLTRMLQAIAKRNLIQRPVSYDSVIDLLSRLISTCDPMAPEFDQADSRFKLSFGDHALPFSWDERNRINYHWTRTNAHILTEKLLMINQNQHATKLIIATLLHFPVSETFDLDRYMYCAITHGIRRNSQSRWGPFLRAAILYCEHSENPKAIHDTALHVARNANHIENNDGSEYLQFFKDLLNLQSNMNDISQEEIARICLHSTRHWVPALLTHYESNVRSDTEDFLGEWIFNLGTEFDPADETDLTTFRVQETQALGNACLEYLHEVYIRQRVQAVTTVLVNIENVTNLCFPYFPPGPEADRYKQNMDYLWSSLRRFMVEEEDDASPWDNSEDDYASDDPMDPITEVEPIDSELEAQL
ncbi:uncharacterized protein EAE97_011195 [Botrytis byssoidea]|uniref:USP domain-containing protein n=1 Tax=Botrytis byssoidea TaxID=139641 RepID=A0A9P5HWZ4_9HELO|nr:uncharacterized protein EAE97_011195 [Botrytis byssoidea]KAF7921904.1 hypothetical protein EAE97_011195 [Botrytis byssoidea]